MFLFGLTVLFNTFNAKSGRCLLVTGGIRVKPILRLIDDIMYQFEVCGLTRPGIEPGPPRHEANALLQNRSYRERNQGKRRDTERKQRGGNARKRTATTKREFSVLY